MKKDLQKILDNLGDNLGNLLNEIEEVEGYLSNVRKLSEKLDRQLNEFQGFVDDIEEPEAIAE